MKPISLIRKELHAFCELAQRRGYKIGGQGPAVGRGVCCPIGAVGIVTNAADPYNAAEALFQESATPFFYGFDGNWGSDKYDSHPLYLLGVEFRRHYGR